MRLAFFAQESSAIKTAIIEHFPQYRYRQLMQWVYSRKIYDPSLMTNLPKDFIQWILDNYSFSLPQIDQERSAGDGSTKYRLVLQDSSKIEMVLIPDKEHKKLTLCVSSQVGCARACNFCATGRMGLIRNLAIHEIVGQIMLAATLSKDKRLTNIVFMGMGEPMDNLDSVLKAISLIQEEDTLAFSPRRITISTCGIPAGIAQLADSGIKAKLAVSLNSALDEVRNTLMPVNRKYSLAALKHAINYYLKRSSFRVTFEYILIPDLNMDSSAIKALQSFVGDLSCKINFIPYNPVPGLPYRAPEEAEIEAFMAIASSLNQAITLRRSRGAEVNGACGQLAAN